MKGKADVGHYESLNDMEIGFVSSFVFLIYRVREA